MFDGGGAHSTVCKSGMVANGGFIGGESGLLDF